MADLSSVTDNYLPTASETFADNLSGSISAGATTVPVNSAVEYPDGATVVLTVDPGTALEATFVGKKDVGADQFIECIWTEGNTAVGHDAGATIIDYDSATHYNLLSEAMQLIMNQDGTLKYDPIADALGLGAAAVNGWEVLPYTMSVSSGYNKGNKEFDITVANADVRSTLSAGMRLRTTRGTSAPTQCFDAESSSSQHASRASGSLTGTISTVTDDVTFEAWVNLESYVNGSFLSRYNGTSGFRFGFQTNGRFWAIGNNGGAGNYRQVISYLSLNLNNWYHLAGTLDMSGWTTATNALYVNGISISVELLSAGTNPTSFAQAGNLAIGSANTTDFLDGKISDVRMWNAIRTATQIRDNMNQQLVGNETNLIGYWKLNGDFNDSTASANHLTGNGGAVATTVDNPMKEIEYAIIQKVTYSAPNSTITVFTGTDHNIPNMSLTAPYYSTQKTPYGFPATRYKWTTEVRFKTAVNPASTAAYANWGARMITMPTGEWEGGFRGVAYMDKGSPPQQGTTWALSTSSTSITHDDLIARYIFDQPSPATNLFTKEYLVIPDAPLNLSAQTVFYLIAKNDSNGGSMGDDGTLAPTILRFYNAYA